MICVVRRMILLLLVHAHILLDVFGNKLLSNGFFRDELLVRSHQSHFFVKSVNMVQTPQTIHLLVLHMFKVLLLQKYFFELILLFNPVQCHLSLLLFFVIHNAACAAVFLKS